MLQVKANRYGKVEGGKCVRHSVHAITLYTIYILSEENLKQFKSGILTVTTDTSLEKTMAVNITSKTNRKCICNAYMIRVT